MARPTVITPEIIEALFDAILDGVSVREFCRRDNMPEERSVYRALARDEEFRQNYARVKEISAYRMDDELIEIADDGRNDWMARKASTGGGRSEIDGEVEQEMVPNHEHIARSKLRVDARKWIMSKLAPKKYGDRLEVDQKTQHSVDGSVAALMERIGQQGKRIHDK